VAAQHPVRVGIVGGGLMGREIAAAIARWPALLEHPSRPVVTAVCDVNPDALAWFDRIETVTAKVSDYRDLLARQDVDVVYAAVRHDQHEAIYLDTVSAGKDLLAEKPFGIDLGAAERIVAAIDASHGVFVRCSSEIPFYPGAQAAIRRITSGEIGPLIEAGNSFCHSADFDQRKPISWKRQREYCGAAGVMNDLGMHVVHVPFRIGWIPERAYAVLQDLVPERPGPDGSMVPCDTYDNAILLCNALTGGRSIPLVLETKRIDPGQKNTWSLRAIGMDGAVTFSTRYPKTVKVMTVDRGEQVWQEVETGSQSAFGTVTGPIFEFGFSDAILQMLAAFFAEREGALGERLGCVTPTEALLSHRLWAAAIRSSESGRAEVV
jgi:predicted dehydrogenase